MDLEGGSLAWVLSVTVQTTSGTIPPAPSCIDEACTIAKGKTAFPESGKPFRPSQTMKNTSRTPPVAQVGQHAHPRLRALPTAVTGPQAEHDPVTLQVDPDGGVERLVTDLPVAHLH